MEEKEIRAIMAQASLLCRTVAEFAEEKGCSRQYIEELIKKGKLDSCFFRNLKVVLMTEKNKQYLGGGE